MDYQKITTQDFEYVDKDIFVSLVELIFGLTFAGYLPPAVVLRRRKWGKISTLEDVPLYELGKAIGLDSLNIQARLKYHNKALWLQLGSFCCIFFGIIFLTSLLLTPFINTTTNATIALLVFLPYLYIVIAISFRLVAKIINGFFAESLCVTASLRLVMLLTYNDVLEHREKKQRLLALIDVLSTNLLLLGHSYNTSKSSSEIKDQFRKISKWLDKQRVEVVFPTETTLKNIRQEFYFFTQNISAGYFGNLKTLDEINDSRQDLSLRYSLTKYLIRFVGFIIPLFIMGTFLWQPNIIPTLHVNTDTLAMVFLLWFLLGIDIYFELGIVSRIIGLVRGLRDL